jgi:hypothetical protein
MNEQIIILDFGSQYTQVIARRVRECSVYSQILRYDTSAAEIARLKPSGIILSGGPSSVYAKDAPMPDKNIFQLGLPVLACNFIPRSPTRRAAWKSLQLRPRHLRRGAELDDEGLHRVDLRSRCARRSARTACCSA